MNGDGTRRPVAQISLLFGKGRRPDIGALRALADAHGDFSVCHEHFVEGLAAGAELLVNGLTFDLSDLAPTDGAGVPECAHRFDVPCNVPEQEVEAISLVPGPHLSGGAAMMPIVRSMLELAVSLSRLDGLLALVWQPAQSWIGPRYFASMTWNWLEGGVFPARGLVGLGAVPDGALQSEGAAFFTGQEIRVEPELMADEMAAANIALRLIDHLVENGPCLEPSAMTGPEGRALHVVPSSNGRMARVWGGRPS